MDESSTHLNASIAIEPEVIETRPDVLTRFKPGQSGNPLGRPKQENIVIAMLRKALTEIHPMEVELAKRQNREPRMTVEVVKDVITRKAMMGDKDFIQLWFHYVAGKPKATISVEGQVEVGHGPTPALETLMGKLAGIREKRQLPESTE